jgi:hypothetical protein
VGNEVADVKGDNVGVLHNLYINNVLIYVYVIQMLKLDKC